MKRGTLEGFVIARRSAGPVGRNQPIAWLWNRAAERDGVGGESIVAASREQRDAVAKDQLRVEEWRRCEGEDGVLAVDRAGRNFRVWRDVGPQAGRRGALRGDARADRAEQCGEDCGSSSMPTV